MKLILKYKNIHSCKWKKLFLKLKNWTNRMFYTVLKSCYKYLILKEYYIVSRILGKIVELLLNLFTSAVAGFQFPLDNDFFRLIPAVHICNPYWFSIRRVISVRPIPFLQSFCWTVIFHYWNWKTLDEINIC